MFEMSFENKTTREILGPPKLKNLGASIIMYIWAPMIFNHGSSQIYSIKPPKAIKLAFILFRLFLSKN